MNTAQFFSVWDVFCGISTDYPGTDPHIIEIKRSTFFGPFGKGARQTDLTPEGDPYWTTWWKQSLSVTSVIDWCLVQDVPRLLP